MKSFLLNLAKLVLALMALYIASLYHKKENEKADLFDYHNELYNVKQICSEKEDFNFSFGDWANANNSAKGVFYLQMQEDCPAFKEFAKRNKAHQDKEIAFKKKITSEIYMGWVWVATIVAIAYLIGSLSAMFEMLKTLFIRNKKENDIQYINDETLKQEESEPVNRSQIKIEPNTTEKDKAQEND